MRDARTQLFDAAERVLLRAGPGALTSRAVTDEAGCAKGVLHRHFADFDSFLAALVLDRAGALEVQGAVLRGSAGTGTVAGNLAEALTALFGSVAVAIVGLVAARDGLRAKLRETWPTGVPVLAEGTSIVASYLSLERDLGRVAPGADIEALTLMLIGGGHLLFAGREDVPPDAVHRMVTAALAGAST
ncbi:helix-turn-helix domain-containing protein [Actinomadura parmotrematis]|nr:helix-turn-helix domain-containing protein [Actinomadura parmotrematis]